MGLDTTHNCWHGSYSSFMLFRIAIARKLGINLRSMKGFGTKPGIAWDDLKPDPIYVLLNHSDCDGHIEVADLIPLADRLDELAATPIPCQNGSWDWAERAKQFADGCRLAASQKQPVLFH